METMQEYLKKITKSTKEERDSKEKEQEWLNSERMD